MPWGRQTSEDPWWPLIGCVLTSQQMSVKNLGGVWHGITGSLPLQKAMTDEQVRQTEETVLDIIAKNPVVYAKEAPLPLAKEVQGLRACFDEVFTRLPSPLQSDKQLLSSSRPN